VDVTSGQACSTCHGTAGVNDAPPKDTSGGTGTNLRGVGAHQVHLAIDATRYRAMTCAMCHTVPTATSSAGHRDTPLPAELTPTGVAAGTTFNGATCSSYCHGSTMGGTAPTWTSTTDMTCVSCHGNPPPAPHPQSATCQGCHDTAGATANSIAKPMQHIDGITQTQNVHPTGYSAREQHGYEADSKGFSTCATASCHGTTLLGGTTGGPSCSSCHPASWQTTCTFVLGATAQSDTHVGAHAEHVTASTNHAAIACTGCHTVPSSATSPGHVDGTGGVVQAEVKFGSLNPSATFNVTTTVCSSLYCHGNGRTSAGTATWTSTTALTCTSCHPTTALASGEHSRHIQGEGMKCSECHSTVVNATPAVINAALHVNGAKEVKLAPSGTWTPSTRSCSSLPGGCHGTKTW
jgi:predicted CxxxxCH...CXXCH cytochrome family protein